MKKQFKPIGLILIVLLSFSFSDSKGMESEVNSDSGDLLINLNNIRNNEGVIYIFLYSYENQYPHEPYTYYRVSKSNVKNGKLKVKVENVAFKSKYAITLIDDENNNEDLDMFLGMPTEGFGFSNNIKPFFSLPDYNELIFSFDQEKMIGIQVQYFL